MKYALGAAAFAAIASPAFAGTTFTNTAPIAVVDGGETSSMINVTGLSGNVTNMTVTLSGLSHTYPDDLVFGLLNENTGVGLVLMSGVGGSSDISDIDIAFNDFAADTAPQSFMDGPLASGTYLVSNFNKYSFTFYDNVQSLSGFFGKSGNASWRLFVDDVFPADTGAIARGWSLTFTTDANGVPEPASWAMMIAGLAIAGAAMRRRVAPARAAIA